MINTTITAVNTIQGWSGQIPYSKERCFTGSFLMFLSMYHYRNFNEVLFDDDLLILNSREVWQFLSVECVKGSLLLKNMYVTDHEGVYNFWREGSNVHFTLEGCLFSYSEDHVIFKKALYETLSVYSNNTKVDVNLLNALSKNFENLITKIRND